MWFAPQTRKKHSKAAEFDDIIPEKTAFWFGNELPRECDRFHKMLEAQEAIHSYKIRSFFHSHAGSFVFCPAS